MNKETLDVNLPIELKPIFADYYQQYLERGCTFPKNSLFLQSVAKVWACSDFIAKTSLQYFDEVNHLFDSGAMESNCTYPIYKNQLTNQLNDTKTEIDLHRQLRFFRQKHMLRIAWRDLMNWSSVENTLLELSHLADVCIEQALAKLYSDYCDLYGIPCNDLGEKQQLIVVALGKLGGEELNFSSDVDLMFCYPSQGKTEGNKRSIENEVFFTRLAQALVKALSLVTADGFVFRVDLRLRPYGDTGPLVMSFSKLESYYQDQGRDWERYALLKARFLNASDPQKLIHIKQLFNRFVYRRYIDYGVVSALRDVKQLMKQDAIRRDRQNDIKLGWGGIREIEFIVQSLQIIHGGKHPQLQTNQLLAGIKKLEKLAYLSHDAAMMLKTAYLFFRKLENGLQITDDKQTHVLPKNLIHQLRLAFAMSITAGKDALLKQVQHYRHQVHQLYHDSTMPSQHFMQTQQSWQKQFDVFQSLWFGDFERSAVQNLLMQFEIKEIDSVFGILQKLRSGFHSRHSVPLAQQRLAKLLPFMLIQLKTCENIAITLERLTDFIDSVIRRSAYLILLLENPKALELLIKLCSKSLWVSQQLKQYPMLLDELLDSSWLFLAMDRGTLESEFQQMILNIDINDEEQCMEFLREFRLANMLRMAVADLLEYCSVVAIGRYLTHLAMLILEQVTQTAYHDCVKQYGEPIDKDGKIIKDGFSIVAYGTFAAWELSYGSDLDLVFLHSGDEQGKTNGIKEISHYQFYVRLAQKILYLLNVRTINGTLYEIDVRLRPSGSAGLLVSHIEAFATYQYENAWTWEHQALVKARMVLGGKYLQQRFEIIRKTVLTRRIEKNFLQKQIVAMRERLQAESPKLQNDLFDIKHSRGGITDIQFIIQYFVLLNAKQYSDLLVSTDNITILHQLSSKRLLTVTDANKLLEIYQFYRKIINRAVLDQRPAQIVFSRIKIYCKWVQELWCELFCSR